MVPTTFDEACDLVANDLADLSRMLEELAHERAVKAPPHTQASPQRHGIIERVSAGVAQPQFAGASTSYTRRG